ncbi:hypothetical protein [Brevundimonas bacteroides]|uniref:hypothetical protein n=1 Tax=Brevundimonas bacteroides TaxID=74311 RepID=UPI0012EDE9FD|nr:hypothetical protein [Brevundimonas bacteroides]
MTDGSPPTASDRLAAIRAAMTDDAEAGAAFGEPVRATVEVALARVETLAGSAPHAEAAALLEHIRDRVSGLDPARLEPRGGLGGLFDSRGKRLKAFRAAYLASADAASSGATDLAERGAAIARRGEDLESLWGELRAGVSALDDHLEAGRAWLSDRAATPPPSPVPPEAAAAFEDMPEEAAPDAPSEEGAPPEAVASPVEEIQEAPASASTASAPDTPHADDTPSAEATPPETGAIPERAEPSDPETVAQETIAHSADTDAGDTVVAEASLELQPAPESEPVLEPVPEPAPAEVTTLPHPLDARLEALAALRARAVAALPRVRSLQNADHAVPAVLSSARDRIETWRADWRDALGLSGKRPRKVRPDPVRLAESRQALIGGLGEAERTASAARARLGELSPPAPSVEAPRAAA